MVQRCALRVAPLAVDFGGAGGDRSVSRACATRAGVYAHRGGTLAAGFPRHRVCRVLGGVHVYGGDATELGCVVSGGGFLSSFCEARWRGKPLRYGVATGDGAVGRSLSIRLGPTRFYRGGLGNSV